MKDYINTVNGKITHNELGYILPHEHMVISPLNEDESTYSNTYEHFVTMYKELVEKYKCRTVVELSPKLIELPGTNYDSSTQNLYQRTSFNLLQEVSRDSGMNIVVCTGYYIESRRPDNFKHRTVSDIANEMILELTKGISGTDVKAGIIKIAVDSLDSESDRKLLAAAAIAQKETGVSITTHTTSPNIRIGALNFLEGSGVNPARIYLGHVDDNAEISECLSLAKRGCSLLFTIWGITNPVLIGWEKGPLPKYHSSYLVKALIDEGYIDQVLLSVDYAASYQDGKLVGWLYDIPERNSLYAYTFAVPSLKRLGISQEDIDRIMMENPKNMLL